MRARTASRGSLRPASIMPSMAALIASSFIFMKSVSVLSRSKMMARTNVASLAGLLGRDADPAPQADLTVVDADVEPATGIAAYPCLVGDGGPVAAVVGQREQHSVAALSAFRKAHVHPNPLPSV